MLNKMCEEIDKGAEELTDQFNKIITEIKPLKIKDFKLSTEYWALLHKTEEKEKELFSEMNNEVKNEMKNLLENLNYEVIEEKESKNNTLKVLYKGKKICEASFDKVRTERDFLFFPEGAMRKLRDVIVKNEVTFFGNSIISSKFDYEIKGVETEKIKHSTKKQEEYFTDEDIIKDLKEEIEKREKWIEIEKNNYKLMKKENILIHFLEADGKKENYFNNISEFLSALFNL